jgi:hypothetical protein
MSRLKDIRLLMLQKKMNASRKVALHVDFLKPVARVRFPLGNECVNPIPNQFAQSHFVLIIHFFSLVEQGII